ncbi:MAG: stage IV sporulation protein A, partial [Thermaerobacterales bacterium]
MEHTDLMQDIATRTSGDVFIGVVGPVRTGKSTFIKKFMDLLVLPRITDDAMRRRALDELPQSGAGRTVMTVEPKFVPDDAVALEVQEGLTIRVRLADSVGFPVEGARGYDEDEGPRMVLTPWFEDAIPFEEAAEVGTRKIIADHSTLGVVVTSDGSIGELPREAFIAAEERTIREVNELDRPFVVVLNSSDPTGSYASDLAGELTERYGAPVIPQDCLNMTEADVFAILKELLYEFPVSEFHVHLPSWVDELAEDHWLRRRYEETIDGAIGDVSRLRDVNRSVEVMGASEFVSAAQLHDL